MIIRFLTQNDIVEHDKVSSQAFSISCDINNKKSVLPSENVLGAFDDDNKTLLADMEIIERKCIFDGEILTCAAVGGVAAKPEHRGKGAVKALFNHLFRMNKYDISILYPFSDEYYRKLGYERVGNSVSVCVPFSEFSKIKRNTDVKIYEGSNKEELLEIYNKCARNYSLCFVRENANAFSAVPYFTQKYTYIWKSNSYATITVKREESTVFVEEIYFDSCESMLGIIGFLRSFESNQKRICLKKLPCNSPILNYISDFENCEIKMYNTGSVRVLNIERVLKAKKYPFKNGGFSLQIGEESFNVKYNQNGVMIDKNKNNRPDLIMDINIASKILLSGISDFEYLPGLTINNAESDFFKVFKPETVFFTDGF